MPQETHRTRMGYPLRIIYGIVRKNSHITGLQRIGGLRRIYVDNLEDKVKRMAEGVNLRCKTLTLFNTNPPASGRRRYLTNKGQEHSIVGRSKRNDSLLFELTSHDKRYSSKQSVVHVLYLYIFYIISLCLICLQLPALLSIVISLSFLIYV